MFIGTPRRKFPTPIFFIRNKFLMGFHVARREKNED